MFFVCIFIVFIYVLHVYASLAYLRHYYNLTNQIPENGMTLREKKKILCTNSFPFVRSISLHGQQFFATHPAIVKFTTFPHWEPFFLRYLSHFHCKFYDESWNFRFSKMNWVKLFSCRYQLTFFFFLNIPYKSHWESTAEWFGMRIIWSLLQLSPQVHNFCGPRIFFCCDACHTHIDKTYVNN